MGTDETRGTFSRRLDALTYQAERDAGAIRSCLRLAQKNGAVSEALESESRHLIEGVMRQADADATDLREFARKFGVHSDEPAQRSETPQPAAGGARRPMRTRPGLINMKAQAIAFGPTYSPRDPLFMDRMAEIMNLSDGTRTISEIARILAHEIGPIEPALVADMFDSLQTAGYLHFV
jgi:hypothetical protein